MQVQDITKLFDEHARIQSAIEVKALNKLKDRLASERKTPEEARFVRYLVLDEIDVLDGRVCVMFGFRDPAPYSGTETVWLEPEEVEDL